LKKIRALKKVIFNLILSLSFINKNEILKSNKEEMMLIEKINPKLISKLEVISKYSKTKEHFLTKARNINSKYLNEILDTSENVSILYRYLKIKPIKMNIYKILTIIRRYRLRISLNKYKFEDKLLYKLSQYVSKYYGKQVEFNIVNLKSIAHNADIFTQILTSKVKRERSNPIQNMNILLNKVQLPRTNRVIETSRLEKDVDKRFIGNLYKNLNISSILTNKNIPQDNLNQLLNGIYNKTDLSHNNQSSDNTSYLKIRDILLDNIKYKNIKGVKLTVKGRLTRRYRADRAIFKLK
jgi:hypothetical protein